jgi:RND family efflux transporter MFP subunit
MRKLIAAPLLLVSVLIISACAKAPEVAAAPVPTPVEVLIASPGTSALSISASGILAAKDEMKLAFKTGGVLKRIYVQAGDTVHSGQLLAELDLTEVGAGLSQAREGVQKAERDYRRAVSLRSQEVIPQAQLDDAKTALNVARAGLSAVGFNAEFSRIKASGDGVVLRKFVQEREVLAPGQPVLAISQDGAGKVLKLALNDRDALRLQIGDKAAVSFDVLPAESFPAVVTALPGGANPGTGLFDVELTLAPTAKRLSSGLIGKATISPKQTSASDALGAGFGAAPIEIPVGALVTAHGESAEIFIVGTNNIAKGRTVKLGNLQNQSVQVLSGLAVGEAVVVRGAAYLSDGAIVQRTSAIVQRASANAGSGDAGTAP